MISFLLVIVILIRLVILFCGAGLRLRNSDAVNALRPAKWIFLH